ncbi:IPT/TIG domain-containing protein [Paenibacillus solisilvae]|uniref:IPT/TIG domain-containing protein n=1 Tax=Paenibacillus solisilvae TaxID=2486751 RepID=A0ABW0W1U0_9BACL
MERGGTLFLLKNDSEGAYDGSVRGISIARTVNAKPLEMERGFQLTKGYIELARSPDLDQLQAFTLEATINPDAVGGQRQNIMEAQSPSVALFIEKDGKLVGSVCTASGWVSIDSGSTLIKAGETAGVRFMRNDDGTMELQINDQTVGHQTIPGSIQNVGPLGFKVGAGIDGKVHSFSGRVSNVVIKQGILDAGLQIARQQKAAQIEQAVKLATGNGNIKVNLFPDASRARLQPIKDLINAAGVEKLSDLDTLRITTKTVMTQGKILLAPRKNNVRQIDWGAIAKEFTAAANKDLLRENLAKYMINRNSSPTLKRLTASISIPIPTTATTTTTTTNPSTNPFIVPSGPIRQPIHVNAASTNTVRGGLSGGTVNRTGVQLPTQVLRESPVLRRFKDASTISDLISIKDNSKIELRDQGIFDKLEARVPSSWPETSQQTSHLYSLKTIPLTSAVIIANTLDLTDTQLVIEPNVTTCYIIAEKIICGNNASITWRRPGGSTPPRQDNPDLNGRGWSGIHTAEGSRDGLSGEDGRAGDPGIEGAKGAQAPNLEIWVKDMSGMPNIDLNGEDGRKGGRGQHGGRGGDGADGQGGEIFWLFGWHCYTDPGDGGEGGDGGNGGRGGRGGNGGTSGNITIGVLDGTLESTVTNRAFKLKNQGGQLGRGGDGGSGGSPGSGGRSGVGEYCKDARNGRTGAQGQPGNPGIDAAYDGIDGSLQFLEFSEDAWEDLLKRPWLSEITPSQAFPGDKITLRGSHFTSHDRVLFGGAVLVPTVNADESISVNIPIDAEGGNKSVYVRREDGTESNRLTLRVKPQLDLFNITLTPGATIALTGRAFLAGASVLINGAATPATVINRNQLNFVMPGNGGAGNAGGTASLQVRNPDGLVSNSRTASIPRVLEIPFTYGLHNLPFGNFTDGIPSWSTYEDTYGAAEVWHEQLDPVFGHPILTAAFYGFYHYFLKGKANGGLATGFCTSLAALVADNLWQGRNDTHTLTKAGLHEFLTAIHGRLLSRESLIHFHDQGREGLARVEKTYREIEATFLRGVDRDNAPLLFFIPSGAIWDSGYMDKLSDSHCVMPYKFVYPPGHPGPQLSANGSTTITDLDGVEMFVWDCNRPDSPNCKLVFRRSGGSFVFDYFPDSAAAKFRSSDGITLGTMTNGQYLLADHDLPFSGPLGLTRFVIDFLLSPADLQITDENGLTAGRFGTEIRSDIPDSHPFYLVPGAYMLPENVALTRKIVGNGSGTYTYNSVLPNGLSVVISDVTTQAGQQDVLSTNADYSQLRFTPGADRNFTMTLARQVGDQVRAVAIKGLGGGPGHYTVTGIIAGSHR